MRFISGDQSVLWDAPLKIMALRHLGHDVVHDVHTADIFSRPPKGAQTAGVTKEAYRADGNVTRWTATIEGCTFLGRMPLEPDLLKRHGVKLDEVASSHEKDLDWACTSLTEGDWTGVHLSGETVAAHSVRMSQIESVYQGFRRPLRIDHEAHFGPASLRTFDLCFALTEYDGNCEWGECSQQHLRKVLEHIGVLGVDIRTTLDMFTPEVACAPGSMLSHFVRYYQDARLAYNQSSDKIRQLENGQLPFYAVVKESGKLVQRDLRYQPGATVFQIIEAAAGRGEQVIAVLGKALLLMLDLQIQGPIALMDQGSLYAACAGDFKQRFEDATGGTLPMHPIYRVRVNALDALADVVDRFTLPEYLRDAFGGQSITGREFAETWRSVVSTASKQLSVVGRSPTSIEELVSFLRSHKLLRGQAMETYQNVCTQLQCFQTQMADLGNDYRLAEVEPKKHRQELGRLRTNLQHEFDYEALRQIKTVLDRQIASRTATLVRDCLQIMNSLSYWNSRPFSHWILALPGWREAVMRRAEVVPEC